jgi:hypothetical protein
MNTLVSGNDDRCSVTLQDNDNKGSISDMTMNGAANLGKLTCDLKDDIKGVVLKNNHDVSANDCNCSITLCTAENFKSCKTYTQKATPGQSSTINDAHSKKLKSMKFNCPKQALPCNRNCAITLNDDDSVGDKSNMHLSCQGSKSDLPNDLDNDVKSIGIKNNGQGNCSCEYKVCKNTNFAGTCYTAHRDIPAGKSQNFGDERWRDSISSFNFMCTNLNHGAQ